MILTFESICEIKNKKQVEKVKCIFTSKISLDKSNCPTGEDVESQALSVPLQCHLKGREGNVFTVKLKYHSRVEQCRLSRSKINSARIAERYAGIGRQYGEIAFACIIYLLR